MKNFIALAASAAATLGMGYAATVTVLPDYDGTFPGLCGGQACEQAVGEFRNGNNGAPGEAIATLNVNTSTGGNGISLNQPGFWDGGAYAFEFAYTSGTVSLSLDIDRNGSFDGSEMLFFNADLSSTRSMYIRAVAAQVPTTLSDLTFNDASLNTDGMGSDSFSGDNVADYLLLTGVNWTADWSLAGLVLMSGDAGFSNARPSVQFKLTDLGAEVPVPAGVVLMGTALAGFAARRRVNAKA